MSLSHDQGAPSNSLEKSPNSGTLKVSNTKTMRARATRKPGMDMPMKLMKDSTLSDIRYWWVAE